MIVILENGYSPQVVLYPFGRRRLPDVQVGDKLSTLEESGRIINTCVTAVTLDKEDGYFEVSVASHIGWQAYQWCPELQFHTPDGIKKVKEFRVGDSICCSGKQAATIKGIRWVERKANDSYHLVCEPHSSFLMDDLWVYSLIVE